MTAIVDHLAQTPVRHPRYADEDLCSIVFAQQQLATNANVVTPLRIPICPSSFDSVNPQLGVGAVDDFRLGVTQIWIAEPFEV